MLGIGNEKKGFGEDVTMLIALIGLSFMSVKENEHVESNTFWHPEV